MPREAVPSDVVGRNGAGAEAASLVATGCGVLAREGYEDLTLGHLSLRGAAGGTIHMKRKGLALREVGPGDVIELDSDGKPLSAPAEFVHLETVLHTEIYRARPDVGAIVHGHPPYATALAATEGDLELITHDSVLFADGLGRFESPDLIMEREQGAAVAEALGSRRAVLLRNHGVVCVGKDVPWAVLTAVTLERSCRMQALASALGRPRPIPVEQARLMAPLKYGDGLVAEYWSAWTRRVDAEGRA